MSNQNSSKVRDFEIDAKTVIHDVSKKVQKLGEKAENLEMEVEAYAEVLGEYVKKNPLKSTAIAALVGIFLGKLL